MDKVKVEFRLPKNKTIEYNGVEIEIIPFMGLDLQAFLISKYVEDYFNTETGVITKDQYDYFTAEANLFSNIMQVCTNIDPDCINNEILGDEALRQVITSQLINFDKFMVRLMNIVKDIKDQIVADKSVGVVIDRLIKEGYAILNKFAEIKPEDLQKVTKDSLALMDRLENSSILRDSNGKIQTNTDVKPQTIRKTRKNMLQ